MVTSGTTRIVPGAAGKGTWLSVRYTGLAPIDDDFTEVNLLFSMQALPDQKATESISELNDRITNLQFTQDVPIWESKIYRERPIITKIDGPVTQYRRWFRQFYSEVGGPRPE